MNIEINDNQIAQIKRVIDEKVTDEILKQIRPNILAEVSKMVVLTVASDHFGMKDRFIVEIKP
jgi:hypothetical protein